MKAALRGAIAGAIATWLMDLVTTGVLAGQPKDTAERERAASPHGKGSVENLVDRLERVAGIKLRASQRPLATQAVHYALGIGPGAAYGVLRDRVPLLGTARGALYGTVLWAVNDELLNTKLGLAGPFGAYPVASHWRGLIGHLALGTTTDTVLDVLGGTR